MRRTEQCILYHSDESYQFQPWVRQALFEQQAEQAEVFEEAPFPPRFAAEMRLQSEAHCPEQAVPEPAGSPQVSELRLSGIRAVFLYLLRPHKITEAETQRRGNYNNSYDEFPVRQGCFPFCFKAAVFHFTG